MKRIKKILFFIWPLLIFLLALIAMANALTEGSVDAWGALYMRDFIQVDGFYIGLATLSFNIFMVIGRFSGDWVRDKIGVFLLIFLFIFIDDYKFNNFYLISAVFMQLLLVFSLLGIGASSICSYRYIV